MREVGGGRTLPPALYFPRKDVQEALLRPLERATRCPLKGIATHYALRSQPDADDVPTAAWSYLQVLDFDPRLAQLEGCVAFDREFVEVKLNAGEGTKRAAST